MIRLEEHVPPPSIRITGRQWISRPPLTTEPLDFFAVHADPCPECAGGDCNRCEGRSVDQERDAPVACPCKVSGHTP